MTQQNKHRDILMHICKPRPPPTTSCIWVVSTQTTHPSLIDGGKDTDIYARQCGGYLEGCNGL